MLIRFRVSNYLSFKEEVEFSMVKGKTRIHSNHIISGGKSRNAVNLLKSGIIYGANASGKSNFIKAIDFARDLIIDGTKLDQKIPIIPFKLDKQSKNKPSKFEFEIRTGGKDYLYGFEITQDAVISEWLYELLLTSQKLLFERRRDEEGKTIIDFDNLNFKSKLDKEFYQFFGEGTRQNQLFLTESMNREPAFFNQIFYWFRNSLLIIFPNTKYRINSKLSEDKFNFISKKLDEFDTGICKIDIQETPIEIAVPKSLQKRITNDIDKLGDELQQITVVDPYGSQLLISKNENGEIVGKELIFKHKMNDCQEEVPFKYGEESDGSMRLLDFIPILYLGKNEEKVILIDELDRSLHPNLCYDLIKLFLNETESSQLIVTTHESNLLTFDLLRRDEIWFIEKDKNGASKMYSLEEFTPRNDKDIQKGYLLGRFGAIPIMGKKQF